MTNLELPSIINYKINLLKNENINFQMELNYFEKKYHISSKNFYKDYKKGKKNDIEDNLLWAGLYEMLIENNEKILILKKL